MVRPAPVHHAGRLGRLFARPPIRRTKDQRATLILFGLTQMLEVSELKDSPGFRGLICGCHMIDVPES
jgi:large subunit ribosomal protein L30